MNSSNPWSKFEDRSIPSTLELHSDIFKVLKKEDRIIDFGCGYGKTCFDLASKGYGSITGVDINQNGIEYAQDHIRKNEITACKFSVENVAGLSFKENSFTFGIMQAFLTTIPNEPDRKSIFSEASRVICPDGYLYIAEFTQSWDIPKYAKRYQSAIAEGYEKGNFPVMNAKTGELEYVARHYTREELTTLLTTANFNIQTLQPEKFTTRTGNIVEGIVIIAKNAKKA
jgi:ubiquinone/menaquinone biosynthesis C-methylase UbiE